MIGKKRSGYVRCGHSGVAKFVRRRTTTVKNCVRREKKRAKRILDKMLKEQ